MVFLLLADGFEEVEALTPYDILKRAGVQVLSVGIRGQEVTGRSGITVKADITYGEIARLGEAPECVIIPGGMPGAANLDDFSQTSVLLEKTSKGGGILAAVCAGPLVLGKRGYLRGKRAVCYPGFEDQLDGAKIVHERVVRDGNIITSVGMGSALEFALEITEALCGKTIRDRISKSIFAK